jgi:hypothetical protein
MKIKNTKTKITDKEKYFLDLLAADVEKSFESEDKNGWLGDSRPAKEIAEFIRNWEP